MSLFIGKIGSQWVHTYSKKLRDKYIKDDYVVVYTLGTGRNGGTKVRGSICLTTWVRMHVKGEVIESRPLLESGMRL